MSIARHHAECVDNKETLEELCKQSAVNQQQVTDQLGYQVRNAVAVLIRALDRTDRNHGRELLGSVRDAELYEAALTIMIRLVFLCCAEERELLPLGAARFDRHYALSTIREQLGATADQFGEEVLQRRHDAWCRLLTNFRAVHGAVCHDDRKLPHRSVAGCSTPTASRFLKAASRAPPGRTPRPRRCPSMTARYCICSKPSNCCK